MGTITAPTSRGADITKGVVSLLGLLALVVAVPVLLISFVGWPLPRSMPSIDDITTALGDRYVPDRFLVGAIAIVCWIIWTELVASVVVEAVALARGRTADRVPLAAGAQKAAARLVAGVALLAALAAARGHTPAVRTLTPATASPSPTADLLVSTSADNFAPAKALPTYTVVPRDTLWGISEACLGDPLRWREIWELNQSRTMGDGRTFTDPDRIHPGWVLTLPDDAAVAAVVAPAPEAAPAAGPEPTVISASTTWTPAPAPTSAPAVRVEVLQPVDGGGVADARVEVLRPVGDLELADAARGPAPAAADATVEG